MQNYEDLIGPNWRPNSSNFHDIKMKDIHGYIARLEKVASASMELMRSITSNDEVDQTFRSLVVMAALSELEDFFR